MKPVNLLPAKHRPHAPSGDVKGGSYAVLGGLGVLLLAVLLYVLTANQVSSRNAEVAKVQQETAQAKAQAAPLGAFGNFAQIKQTRLASVQALAQVRIDWERMLRETARVLPQGVYLTTLTASDGSTPGSSTPTSAPADGSAGGPSLELNGCANSHPQVAVTMVRLRQLHLASDVELTNSQAVNAGAGGGTTDSAGGAGGCTKGVQFAAKVTFSPGTGSDDAHVPADLGGGS